LGQLRSLTLVSLSFLLLLHTISLNHSLSRLSLLSLTLSHNLTQSLSLYRFLYLSLTRVVVLSERALRRRHHCNNFLFHIGVTAGSLIIVASESEYQLCYHLSLATAFPMSSVVGFSVLPSIQFSLKTRF